MIFKNIHLSVAIIAITLGIFIFPNPWRRYVRIITSEKFFLCSLLATGTLITLGTLIIQLLPEDKYTSLYGITIARLLIFLEFDDIFHSKIFIFILTCLGISSLGNVLETLRCYRLISIRTLDGLLPHTGIIVILLGCLISELGSFVGVMDLYKGQKKYFIQFVKGDEVTRAIKKLPFGIYLDDFSIRYYNEDRRYRLSWYILDKETGRYNLKRSWKNNVLKEGIFLKELSVVVKKDQQYARPGAERFFVIETSSVKDIVLNYSSAESYILLNDGLNAIVFELPRQQVKEYVSTIRIVDKNNQEHVEHVKVNYPVKQNGYWIYQLSYKIENEVCTVLQIGYDPGWKVVLTGIILIGLGVVVMCLKNLIVLGKNRKAYRHKRNNYVAMENTKDF